MKPLFTFFECCPLLPYLFRYTINLMSVWQPLKYLPWTFLIVGIFRMACSSVLRRFPKELRTNHISSLALLGRQLLLSLRVACSFTVMCKAQQDVTSKMNHEMIHASSHRGFTSPDPFLGQTLISKSRFSSYLIQCPYFQTSSPLSFFISSDIFRFFVCYILSAWY